jgi:hypothetical protein
MVLPWLEWYSLKDWIKDLQPHIYAQATPVAGGIRLPLTLNQLRDIKMLKNLKL